MNPFDHVAVAFSMVLSLGIVRLLDGLRPARLPLLHPFRAVQGAGLTISILGAASASPALHAVLAPLALLLQSLGLGTLFFSPRGLTT